MVAVARANRRKHGELVPNHQLGQSTLPSVIAQLNRPVDSPYLKHYIKVLQKIASVCTMKAGTACTARTTRKM